MRSVSLYSLRSWRLRQKRWRSRHPAPTPSICPTQSRNHYNSIGETKWKCSRLRYLISPPANPPKFIRRKDLALEIRVALVAQAFTAQINHIWGKITDLSREYKVSRTFIYSELSIFKKEMGRLFFPEKKVEPISRQACEAAILAYRFEGKCSIDAISTLMKRTDMLPSSTGFISQYLSYTGGMLDNILKIENRTPTLVVFADDEVFAKSSPVLITVDPVSSAILRIELAKQRTAEAWLAHYQSILDSGFVPRL